ncbi:MAG: PASTA domain-containing protein [Acidobacteria bacterium]|nr:PASTA domain-containing protein [Acidobacteriota bacterium]
MSQTSWVWKVGRFLVLSGALGATFVVFAVLSARIVTRSRDVTVPAFVGQSVDDATRQAASVELPLSVDTTRRPDPTVPAGYIIEQDPVPGTTTRRQRRIRVWVSAGPQVVRMPAVVGQTQRMAELRLAEAGLAVAGIAEVTTNALEADRVVAQDPPPSGSGRDVHLLVNRGYGRQVFVMPDLVGVDGTTAAELLRTTGLRVTVAPATVPEGTATGFIARQTPNAGSAVTVGDAVTLEVVR